jgi:hypothetical protein
MDDIKKLSIPTVSIAFQIRVESAASSDILYKDGTVWKS